MNLCEILHDQARARPQAVAILDRNRGEDRITTFADLEKAVAQGAALLWEKGFRPGDVVLVLQPMSAELYTVLLALFRLGLVAMFLDPSAGKEHTERCCELKAPRGFIASAKAHLLRLWCPALRRIPIKLSIGFPVPGATSWLRSAKMPPRESTQPCGPATPALLTFTSGSTGQPKGAVRSHGFLVAQHRVLEHSLELQAGEVDLTTMPIVLLANLASGVTSVIPDADLRYPGSITPAPVIEQMIRYQTVSSTGSPALFERLARYCKTSATILPRVQKLFTGGAPVFPRLLDQMHAMAPEAEIVAVYGSTEAEPIAHIERQQISNADREGMLKGKGLIAGRPVEEIRLRIFRDQWGKPVGPYTELEFEKQCEPAGQPGEIVVHGDHVLTGYLDGRGDEETKFRVDGEGWHRTGDAGYLDDLGRVWLLGRCSARIRDSRGELYPFAAETAVYSDSSVRRAAMVSHAGKRVLALEHYSDATGPQLSSAQLRQELAWTQVDEIRVCKTVPVDKRHNAKIDYPALYKLLESDGRS